MHTITLIHKLHLFPLYFSLKDYRWSIAHAQAEDIEMELSSDFGTAGRSLNKMWNEFWTFYTGVRLACLNLGLRQCCREGLPEQDNGALAVGIFGDLFIKMLVVCLFVFVMYLYPPYRNS